MGIVSVFSPMADFMNDKSRSSSALSMLQRRLTRQAVTSLQVCVHCGQCADTCHYYLATEDPRMTPVYKMDRVRKVYKRTVDWLGRVAPGWVGAPGDRRGAAAGMGRGGLRLLHHVRALRDQLPDGRGHAPIIRTARAMLTAWT